MDGYGKKGPRRRLGGPSVEVAVLEKGPKQSLGRLGGPPRSGKLAAAEPKEPSDERDALMAAVHDLRTADNDEDAYAALCDFLDLHAKMDHEEEDSEEKDDAGRWGE